MLLGVFIVSAALAASAPAQAAAGGGASSLSGPSGSLHRRGPVTRTLARKGGKSKGDPADSQAGDPAEARKGKAGDTSASGGKARGGASGGSLDSLMADVVSEEKGGKGKKGDSREMDAILKDVQKKQDPAPVVKKEEPAAAPPLSPAEISAAMSQLKVRGNACAQRLGRGGTAELKITVSKEGRVTDVKLGGKLVGTPVGTCIEHAAGAIIFRRNAGLRFDYRMDVR